jgi:hypothetical protein
MSEAAINVGGVARRIIGFKPGPLFFEEDGVVMFQIGLDASSVIGPYPAKPKDKVEYQGEWRRFLAESAANEAPPAVDDEKATIHAELKRLGKPAHHMAGLPKLRALLEEARGE